MPFNLRGSSGTVDIGKGISYSCRFNDNDSAYLTRTPGASNRDTWTFSAWVKLGNLGAERLLFSAGADANNLSECGFDASNRFQYQHLDGGAVTDRVTTTAVFRDVGGWAHFVCAVDTTNATEANRVRLYVNGVEQTSLSTANYPVQNVDTDVNSAVAHQIGARIGPSLYMDGYLAEVVFIDGTQLTPSSFGHTSADTGEWVPSNVSGLTFGTNGAWFDFADSANLGNDANGGTDWTESGLASNDQVPDTPTENYCVINAIRPENSGTATWANGNLDTTGGATNYGDRYSTFVVTSGKWYAECTMGAAQSMVGVSDYQWTGASYLGNAATGWSYAHTGNKWNNNTSAAYGDTYTTNDVIGIALDMDAGKIWFSKNGVFQASGDPAAGTNEAYSGITGNIAFACSNFTGGTNTTHNWNFGQLGFAYTPPTGFKELKSSNLPDPAIVDPSKYFNALLWTGDNASPRSISGVGFSPDLVWAKSRSAAYSHTLWDTVRGTNARLISEDASDEAASGASGWLSAFEADGFEATIGGTDHKLLNENTTTYVAWNWKANGSGASNTDGDITTTVSANTLAGISILTYTGNGSNNQTLGHGLGATPAMIIQKLRDSDASVGAESWGVYHKDNTAAPETDVLFLDLNSNTSDSIVYWNDTAPTSSLITIAGTGHGNQINASGEDYLMYVFAEVAGFSQFGSYTGNGAADGPFVYCGFKPAFVLLKNASVTATGWEIYDTIRDSGNQPLDLVLQPDTAAAEVDGSANSRLVDVLSNGFKIRHTSNSINGSGNTLIYAAFADSPFKYARAR